MVAAVSVLANDIRIRKATEADAVVLALLARVTFAETFEPYFTDRQGLLEHYEATFSVQNISRSLRNPNNVFWIATHKKLPVGYIKLKKEAPLQSGIFGRASQLEKIYVLKDYLSKGVGQQLQQALYNELRTVASQHLWLHVWEKNLRAIGFYQKHGFVEIDRNFFTVGRDQFCFLTMNKNLRFFD